MKTYFFPTAEDIAESCGSLCYTFCDVNGDAAPGLIIKETCLDAADQSVTYNSVLCI